MIGQVKCLASRLLLKATKQQRTNNIVYVQVIGRSARAPDVAEKTPLNHPQHSEQGLVGHTLSKYD